MPDILSVFSIFTSPEAWISLLTLTFLEIVLGIDNIVFISITSNRLPEEKRHIGRKLGLAGALLMRIAFLSVASYLVHMMVTLVSVDFGFYAHDFTLRDVILLVGGSYLIYKGISEVVSILRLDEVKAEEDEDIKAKHQIGLAQAVSTIMVMDIVFSIDSVITAVGLAEHLIVMILAVMTAVFMMMIFIDAISDFINKHVEMKILAMVFIAAIGVLLVLDSLGINSGVEMLDMHAEKLMVYFAMLFAVILTFLQLAYKTRLARYLSESASETVEDVWGEYDVVMRGEKHDSDVESHPRIEKRRTARNDGVLPDGEVIPPAGQGEPGGSETSEKA